jgi:hypothetical protein
MSFKFVSKTTTRRLSKLFIGILIFAAVFFLLRGPYLSNSIKRVILPVLEDATGQRIIIDKAVINLFPFYLQTKSFKMFDDEGNRLLWVTKMRAYIDLLGLFSKEIRIRRLTAKEPRLSTDTMTLKKIVESVNKKTAMGEDGGFYVSLKSAKITDGEFILTDTTHTKSAAGSGIYVEMAVKDPVTLSMSIEEGSYKLSDQMGLKGGFDGRFAFNKEKIKVYSARLHSTDSSMEVSGELFPTSEGGMARGTLTGKAKIFAETLNEFFSLKQGRKGELSLSGSVDLVSPKKRRADSAWPDFKVGLKTKGWFHLQTLMEILNVHEKISGRVSLDGSINGIYPEVKGEGALEAENVVLDTLPLDDVKGKITYHKNKFGLKDFTAHTYDGELNGDAFVMIPSGRYYVDAGVKDINSPQFFKFIQWEPPFPEGKVSGNFTLNKSPDREIELLADARYVNKSGNSEIMVKDRLKRIETDIVLREGLLTLSNSVLSTADSTLFLDGTIDLDKERLSLALEMESRDIRDFTVPYFSGLRAPVRFTGKAGGLSSSPEISGTAELGQGTIRGVMFKEASAELTYSPEKLTVESLKVKQGESLYNVSGFIDFRKTSGLFSFDDPYFSANADIEKGDSGALLHAVYKKLPITGALDGVLSFEGDIHEFSGKGDVTLKDGVIYGRKIDQAIIKTELFPDRIIMPSIEVIKGQTKIDTSGSLFFDTQFNVSISSDNLNLSDLAILENYPVDVIFNLDLSGSGSLKNPDLRLSMNIVESYFKGIRAGKGDVSGELRDRKLSLKGNVFGGVANLDASADLSEEFPWSMDIELNKGRYDFLLAGFLEDVPRDISASMEGTVSLKGMRDKISMDSRLSSLIFTLYGYNFKNKDDIVLKMHNDSLKIESFSIRGGNGDITAAGIVNFDKNIDLTIEGKVNLTPLKAITRKVKSLKGLGNFSVAVTGPWKSPELRGEINIMDGTIAVSDIPYTIGPFNGDIFLDKDRIIFESFVSDFAGGKVFISGVGQLEKLSLNRLSLSSRLEGIKLRPAEGLNIAFDGKLYFEKSPLKQSLLGDIDITSATYTKRFEWKSGLLQLNQINKVSLNQPPLMKDTELNIYIKGQEDIFIDNNIARTPVKIDINVQGTLAQYGLLGRIEAKGGTVFFRGNEFEVINGSVDLVESNRVVPIFHIQSETFVKGYRVRLNLDGPADRFTLSLFSDPPLPDDDIMTLLTSGQINNEAEGLEGGIGTGEATAFLTGRLQDVIEERFKFITGFERFEIDPHTTATGAVSSKITVGKRMLGENLLVTYSSSVGSTELDVIKLRYNLNRNFSIVGLRDEIGSLGADFRYRFEFE